MLTFSFHFASAQKNKNLISGPWAGNVELRSAMVWLEVDPSVKSVSVKYNPLSDAKNLKTIVYKGE